MARAERRRAKSAAGWNTAVTGIAEALAGGLLLGVAGSFHCACMCGGIASGSLMILNPPALTGRVKTLLCLQAGRVSFYAVAGSFFAGIAGLTIGPNATASTFKALQWMSAAVLMWAGFTMAGLLPRIVLPAAVTKVGIVTSKRLSLNRGNVSVMPLAMGLAWGMTPCPMVYAALVPATLTGSAASGMAWMTGFGIGTMPAVMAAGLGISALSRVRRWRGAEVAAGLAVAIFGLLSVAGAGPKLALFCSLQ